MALGNWISGLFQSEQTRGLSGGSAPSIALDDKNPYYNYRLRRHRAEGDLVEDPSLLWYTSPLVKQRTGLGTHVASEIGDGRANYTDILMILSASDYAKAERTTNWHMQAQRLLRQEFEALCGREGLRRRYDHRKMGFRFVADGSDVMNRTQLGLAPGEFVTGLLPNLYTGPISGSWPVVSVHLNMPGEWEGYREVGRLHNDQRLFTLGAHWLDNFAHRALREAALYRLQQYADGSFVHIVNPDLQDRYQVTSEVQAGTNVLTLATRGGEPLAYIVLVLGNAPSGHATSGTPAPAPAGHRRPPSIPSVAPPMLNEDPNDEPHDGHRSIVPDGPSERIFALQERGVLLQKVHFSAFMLGYDVYFGKRGELGTVVEDPAATFQVRRKSVSVVPHITGMKVDGVPIAQDTEHTIEGNVRIEVDGHKLEYRDLRALKSTSGWPYVGEIRRPASSTYMLWGEAYHVGRSRDCRVVLPDESRNDNIRWKPKVGDGATIRARSGDIPKSKFYTDSIMVASEHATVDLRDVNPRVICTARHCYVFVRRGRENVVLHPATSAEDPKDLDLRPGDEILIGNCLFHVGYTPADAGARPAPAPPVQMQRPSPSPAASLTDPPLPPPIPLLHPRPPGRYYVPTPARADRQPVMQSLSDVPVPHGLGEWQGAPTAPPPPPVSFQDLPDTPLEASLESSHDDQAPTQVDGPAPSSTTAASVSAEDLPVDDEVPTTVEGTKTEAQPDPGAPLQMRLPVAISTGADEWPTAVGTDLDDKVVDGLPSESSDADEPSSLLASPEENEPLPGLVDPFRRGEVMAPPPPVPQPDVGGWDEDWDDGERVPHQLHAQVTDIGGPSPLQTPAFETDTFDEPPTFTDPETEGPALAKRAPQADPPPRQAVVIDDREALDELGRPLHIVLSGWMLNGEFLCGNHSDADLILPENRFVETQTFEPVDYFRLKIRGKQSLLSILAPDELWIDDFEPEAKTYDTIANSTLDVTRRDESGDERFTIRMRLYTDDSLPDPRARLLAQDHEDPDQAALFTRGLLKGADRRLSFGEVTVTTHYDGEQVVFSDYLDTYRSGDTFLPFFIQRGEGRFMTAPHDGTPFTLQPGDRFIVGMCVYILTEE